VIDWLWDIMFWSFMVIIKEKYSLYVK
jgi:hypothetical protein